MTFENLLNRFLTWGKSLNPAHEKQFRSYFSTMLKRKRVLIIEQNDSIECIICFFLVNDVKDYINRPMWSTPEDIEDGHIVFVDKMVANHWTPSIRRLVQSTFESEFPKITEAFWLREPLNRSVIIYRGGKYVHS